MQTKDPNFSVVLPGGCNGKCKFCFWDRTPGSYTDFTATLRDFVKRRPAKYDKISITGGEPTLSSAFGITLDLIKGRFSKVVMTTNGGDSLDWIPKIAGVVQHVNLSRHHNDGGINNSIFGREVHQNVWEIARRLHAVGIDLTLNCVVTSRLSVKDYLNFAKANNVDAVSFRKQHGTLSPHPIEKAFSKYPVLDEFSCPVCRTRTQVINGMRVLWKCSSSDPAKVVKDFELILHQDGRLAYDWNKLLPYRIAKPVLKRKRRICRCSRSNGGGGGGSCHGGMC